MLHFIIYFDILHFMENIEGGRRTAIIANLDLAVAGGTQESTRNMMGFRSSDWLLFTPHAPTGENERYIKGFNIPGSRQFVPSPSAIKGVVRELQAYDPGAIIINHPDLITGTIFAALPPELKERSHAIWRGQIDTKGSEILGLHGLKAAARTSLEGVRRRIHRYVGAGVQTNLVVSQSLEQSLQKSGITNNIQVIPQQVGGEYSPAIRYSEAGKHERRAFLDDDELGVLVVSRISPERGLPWLVDTYRDLKENRKHMSPDSPLKRIQVALAGPARDERFLDQIKQQFDAIDGDTKNMHGANAVSFKYLGALGREELQEVYNAYDILVNPCPADGFGRTIVESTSAGMTAIGREGNLGVSEQINKPPYSIGVMTDTPTKAAGEIITMAQTPGLLESLQTNAAQWSQGHYSLRNAETGLWEAIKGRDL